MSLQKRLGAARLQDLVQDAYRFILYHRVAIENSPLQAYSSGLAFSPLPSMIKQLFQHEGPNYIAMAPVVGDDWDAQTGACLQTLEGHSDLVDSVVLSHDSSRVASGSKDSTINIWDVHTGACLQTLYIGSAVHNLSFDTIGSSLHTDIGIIALRDSPTSAHTTSKMILPSELQSPLASQELQVFKHQGYGICSDLFWLTRHSKKWLWLPSMYPPIRSVVGQSGLALVLGCQSGRILIFGFAGDDCN